MDNRTSIHEEDTARIIAALSEKRSPAAHCENVPEVCPLTSNQLGIFLECQGKPDSTVYNTPFMITLPEGTDKARFIGAVKTAASFHPALFVTVGTVGGVPSMIYHGGEITVTEKDEASAKDYAAVFRRPFDLENGPLCRFEYVRTPDGDFLFFDVHHIVFDGTSERIFLAQIAEVYGGGNCESEELTQFDAALDETLPSPAGRESALRTYFENTFGGADTDSKPVPDVVVKNGLTDWGLEKAEICEKLPAAVLSDFAKANGISENALFLGAFGYALAKMNGQSASAFTTASHGRFDKRLARTVGMFVRTLPILCRFDENEAPADYLRRVYNDFYITKQNDSVPFSELASEYGLGMDASFIFQSDLFLDLEIGGKNARIKLLLDDVSAAGLEMMVIQNENGYTAECRHLRSDYTPDFAREFVKLYVNVLCGMVKARTLGGIALLDGESEALLDSFNRTEVPYEDEKTVVELFREQAKATPDALCVVYCDKKYTYRETDGLTDRLARRLVSLGIGRGNVVGVLIPRCEYMLIASLGVLKAGAAYMPLDPTYPPERLNLMMTDSGASMLITTPELSGIITDDFTGRRMMTEEIPPLPGSDIPLPTPDKDDLFILLYTSGSTGTPKGVMFAHSNTMVTAAWERRFYGLGEGCAVTAYASYGFDANVFDTYATVTSGAALHIISDEIRLDLPALRRYFDENGITHSTMTTQVGRQFAEMGGSKSLRFLNVAGEKLTPLDPPEGFRLYNLYGPTEGSILMSGFEVDRLYRDVPIGGAIDNVKLYVVDPLGRRLPAGGVGELWMAGAHVTKGYLNRPDKTAEAYGDNPFSTDAPYDRVYRTGDIVRMMGDGNLQFIGRRDGQVKVRGFRVELTEVEEVIRRFESIKDATVAAFDEPSGGKYLAAYVVADEEIDTDALNAFIRSEKPPYMIPAVTMQIEKIPLNQNQKVNKKALPKPERKAGNVKAPANETEQKIYDIVADIVGHRAFGTDTDVYEAGLTSIGSLKLNVRLDESFDVPVKLDDIKKNPTVCALAALVSSGTKAEEHEILPDYPLTQTQMGIYVESCASPDALTYNMPLLLKLGGGIDTAKLTEAVKCALDAHPYVKATLFADCDGNIRAKRNDDAEANVRHIKCDVLPDSLVRPFDLLGGTLYRVEVYETLSGNYLFADFHHIVSDGTSENVFLSDVDRAYAGETVGKEKYTGFEAALDEEAARASDRYADAKAYYDSVFAGCETNCLPPKCGDASKPGASTVRRAADGADRVKAFCGKHRYSENAFMNAAFGYTLSRFGQFDDAVFTTVYNGRSDPRLASSVTMLVKTLPVLVHTEGAKKVDDLISETQTQLVSSMANDIYSFAEIASAYGIRSDVIFVYQGEMFSFDHLCGEAAESVPVMPEVSKAPLTLTVYVKDGTFEIDADYRTDTFCEAFVESFLDVFCAVVSGFCEKDNAGEIPFLSEKAERRLAEINDTARPYENIPVHRFVERHAAEHPDRVAVADCETKLTYGEMNALANRMAHSLIALGVKENDVIGFMLERTVMLSVTELAILKSGGAFLGLLPGYPDDRVEFCLTDADSPVVITTEEIKTSRPALFAEDKPYRTVTVEELLLPADGTDPDVDISTESLAYCIYTSGSTGNPKGVTVRHRNLACLAEPADFTYSLYHGEKGGDVALALSSVSFDMSVFDNLLILMNGRTVCIASDREIHNPAALAELMMKNSVDTIAGTPSFLTNCIGIPEFRPALAGIKTLVSGAEAFPATLYGELKKLSPGMHVINGYGPSECTITCCAKELDGKGSITIGGPSANTAFYVLDRFGNVLPPFACGELIICGDLVGGGYVKLPEKTAASFFTLRGLPAYHSGDVVRLNADGEVEFFGRKDNQVKLRGFRVELDEIEKCICSFPGVTQSKVIVRNNGSEDFLCGFYTADRETDPDKLNAHMKSKLTYYMVPDAMMQLESMPLTPSGKIDKKALPEIKRERKKTGRKAPKKSLEQELCELFASVLGLDEFYADDNFFEMGGTSLSASKVTMQLMSRGMKAEYQDIFSNPTPEMLAEYLGSQSAPAETAKKESDAANGEFDDVLSANTVSRAAEVVRESIGDVLLTGAVGFLGIHVLRELIERREGKIVCLVRHGDSPTSEQRLKTLLMYYFDDLFEDEFGERITVIDADITDDSIVSILDSVHFDTLINCAACVKHYAADDVIEKINVTGVENLIKAAMKKNARMIQISTTSVPGVHTAETWERQVKMHENELFVIDDMENKYCISKYRAERKMLEAVRAGLRGKIIRVGNLMGRQSDGEFQINFETNAFMSALRGFSVIGKCPVSHATDPMSFSPIDMTARAVVLLAGTNDQFTAFHADSRYGFDEWQLITAANNCGVKIVPVPDEEYYADYYRMLGDEKINAKLQGLVTNDRPDLHMVETDNLFTANVLYRLGFAWELVDGAYLERAINSLLTLDYFEPDTEDTL